MKLWNLRAGEMAVKVTQGFAQSKSVTSTHYNHGCSERREIVLGKDWGKANKADILLSIIDHPTMTKW